MTADDWQPPQQSKGETMSSEQREDCRQTEEISREESFWLWMMRRNAATPVVRIYRTWKVWNLRVRFSWRSRKNLGGRFGGGWNWKLGLTAGGRTVAIHLLVAEVSVTHESQKAAT